MPASLDEESRKSNGEIQAQVQTKPKSTSSSVGLSDYKGFAAGVFSGIAKLTVGHPFDTIKVRLQTSANSQFSGPLDCLLKTVKNEGVAGVYKGVNTNISRERSDLAKQFLPGHATPHWMDVYGLAVCMLGSLTLYRRLLNENFFNKNAPVSEDGALPKLPTIGHAIAGLMAGSTVSFIAAPVEHVKARLQVQYQADKSQRIYKGPIDCTKKLLSGYGIKGLYHGLGSTLIFRGFFFFWWGSYDLFSQAFQKHTSLSTPSINFWAGGFSAQVFWLTSYPSDVVKQRIMTDPLDSNRKFARWRDAVRAVYAERGWRGYWRGFLPCFLRSFPANAAALTAFEFMMRTLP